MEKKIHYANWWSKLLFKKKFENQFFLPIPPSRFERWAMRTLERRLLNGRALPSIEKPIFIVGLPRSGTSVIYNLLCAHESAAYVTNVMNSFPEAPFAAEWARKKFRWDVRGERFLKDSIDVGFGSPSEPLTFWGRWMGRDFESLYWAEQTAAELGPERLNMLRNDIGKILLSFGVGSRRRLVVKSPVMQTEMRLLQEIFPDAKFIHILRDARPTANSLTKLFRLTEAQLQKINHPQVKSLIPYPRVRGLEGYIKDFGPNSTDCTARVWVESVEAVIKTSADLKNFYQFKYEDLVSSPEEELRKIFRFCELGWPDIGNENFRAEFAKIGKIEHKNNYSGYEEIMAVAGPLMAKLGYQTNAC